MRRSYHTNEGSLTPMHSTAANGGHDLFDDNFVESGSLFGWSPRKVAVFLYFHVLQQAHLLKFFQIFLRDFGTAVGNVSFTFRPDDEKKLNLLQRKCFELLVFLTQVGGGCLLTQAKREAAQLQLFGMPKQAEKPLPH